MNNILKRGSKAQVMPIPFFTIGGFNNLVMGLPQCHNRQQRKHIEIMGRRKGT
jgi:hypothetical protein